MSWRYPLRRTLPLALLLLSLPMALFGYLLAMDQAKRDIEQRLTERAAHTGNQFTAILKADIRHGDLAEVERIVKTLVTMPNLRWAVLVDNHDKVTVTTDYRLLGRDITTQPNGPPAPLLTELRQTLSGRTENAPDHNTLWAVYPLRMPLEKGELRAERVGALVLAFNTAELWATARHEALDHALLNMAAMFILAVLLWFYLDRVLVKRIEALTAATQGELFESGRKIPAIRGDDEIAQLARHFAAMGRHLADRNRQLGALFAQSFQFAALLSKDGVVLDINQLALDFAGARRDEVLGRHFWETPWWDHDAQEQAWLQGAIAAAAAGEHIRQEVSHLDRDGVLRAVNFSLRPILDGAGRVLWLLAEGHDITALKEATEAAQEGEQRFRTLVANVPGVVYRCELRFPWPMSFVSEGVEALAGYGAGDFLNGERQWGELILEADRPLVMAAVQAAAEAGSPILVEYRIRHADGTIRWVTEQGQVIGGDGDGSRWADGVILDITERRLAEEHAQRLRALYSTLSHTNTTIVRTTSTEDLFPRICRIAVEHGGLQGAWIGMLDEASGWITPVASTNMDHEYLKELRLTVDPRLEGGQGPSGTALREGRHYICNDFLSNPHTAPWHDKARELGIEASAAFPLRRGGQLVGVLSLYAGVPGFFTEDLIGLLQEMAADISFALDNLARQEELQLAASVFDSSRELIVITDADSNIIRVNRAFSEVTGYDEAEVLGRNIRMLKSGRQTKAFYESMWQSIAEVGYWQGELWNRRKSGELYPAWVSVSAVKNEQGEVVKYLSVASDITEYKQVEDRVRYLAYYDPLTDLPNRTLLRDRTEQVLRSTRRTQSQAAMLFVDLDHFKTINDSLGHVSGDQLLKEVSQRIRNNLRTNDTVSRLGGDEFLLLLPETDATAASHVAHHLLQEIGKPFTVGGHALSVTASIGIATFPSDGESFEDLHKNADIAMYKAKELGRNRVHFFTQELNSSVMERLTLESAMRQGVERGEFTLHYQPQLRVADNRLIGVEALLRWEHPTLGPISPAKFIPIAEESGLIEALGEWVLREACHQNQQWQAAGLPPFVVAVNVSARQFSLCSMYDVVKRALDETGLAPEYLEVEITESLLARDLENTLEVLRQIKSLGVKIAVDDFGTGYSSLAYLKRFPLDKLKIDQSFVRDLVSDADDRAIAAGVINLGHSLGLTVIAEGVETEAHLAMLREFGCDEAQGYLISRPVRPAQLIEFIEARQQRAE